MVVAETMVRMGELAASGAAGDVLTSIGLGSCIGLALVSRVRSVGGLAHVMLPESPGGAASAPARYADSAVPALVHELERLGSGVRELDAILVGGAQMFALGGSSLDIGSRNEDAVRGALDELRIPVRAAATGADKGRTIRVHVATGLVLVKEVGGVDTPLHAGREEARAAA
jgi:chemotaxis protein CheD